MLECRILGSMEVPDSSSQKTPASKVGKSPNSRTYIQVRPREHLTPHEVEAMIQAARTTGRHGHRDSTLILLAYRHGLRISELVTLQWAQIDFAQATLHVNRLKKGTPSTHPLRGVELRALRKLQKAYPDSSYLFVSERRAPLSADAARHIIERAGQLAIIPFSVHPHMLRHATGFYLASQGVDMRAIQAYLGHRNIQHTVRYTELAPGRFKDLWLD
jgi:type 1 fimbriae regulatory protein FimB/type 1 fimbriae regulatory protein FimE